MFYDEGLNLFVAAHGVLPVCDGDTLRVKSLIADYPESCLFASSETTYGITDSDVVQGGVGDCWLLAGLASLADKRAEFLRGNILEYPQGMYEVRFFNGLVVVDSYVLTKNDNIYGASLSRENEYWPILFEKAFMKYFASELCPPLIRQRNSAKRMNLGEFHGMPSYIDIHGGYPKWVYQCLLGIPEDIPSISTLVCPDKFILDKLSSSGVGCCCSSTEFGDDSMVLDGIVQGHAYSIVGVHNGLIRLRNPWAKVEHMTYDDGKNDGEFSIDVQTFKKQFPVMYFIHFNRWFE